MDEQETQSETTAAAIDVTAPASTSQQPDPSAESSQPTATDENPDAQAAGDDGPTRDPRYPMTVIYCSVCTLPAELHEYHSTSQFEK